MTASAFSPVVQHVALFWWRVSPVSSTVYSNEPHHGILYVHAFLYLISITSNVYCVGEATLGESVGMICMLFIFLL